MSAIKWLLNFPLSQYAKSFAEDFAINVLRTGPIPHHVAFVLDGNRRFAKNNDIELGEGHFAGFQTVVRVVEHCARLGVQAVSVYAFSIENFNRPQHEVDILFNMLRSRVVTFLTDSSFTSEFGIKVRVLGNRDLLSRDILEKMEEVEAETAGYTQMIFNICCPYTSRDDITHAIRDLVTMADAHEIGANDITEEMIQQHLYLKETPPLDILVRTSGATRFSDFMLWEGHMGCHIEFVTTLWPDFTVWELYRIFLRWSYRKAKELAVVDTRQLSLINAPPAVSVTETGK